MKEKADLVQGWPKKARHDSIPIMKSWRMLSCGNP